MTRKTPTKKVTGQIILANPANGDYRVSVTEKDIIELVVSKKEAEINEVLKSTQDSYRAGWDELYNSIRDYESSCIDFIKTKYKNLIAELKKNFKGTIAYVNYSMLREQDYQQPVKTKKIDDFISYTSQFIGVNNHNRGNRGMVTVTLQETKDKLKDDNRGVTFLFFNEKHKITVQSNFNFNLTVPDNEKTLKVKRALIFSSENKMRVLLERIKMLNEQKELLHLQLPKIKVAVLSAAIDKIDGGKDIMLSVDKMVANIKL